jgi:hypothetical protein
VATDIAVLESSRRIRKGDALSFAIIAGSELVAQWIGDRREVAVAIVREKISDVIRAQGDRRGSSVGIAPPPDAPAFCGQLGRVGEMMAIRRV